MLQERRNSGHFESASMGQVRTQSAPIGLEITGTAHIEVPTLKRAFTQEIELACAQRVVLIHSASTPRLTRK